MTTRDQGDLILVFWRIGGPAVLADIYAEYKRQHPSDLYVKNRKTGLGMCCNEIARVQNSSGMVMDVIFSFPRAEAYGG
jgi:hypothetical protein